MCRDVTHKSDMTGGIEEAASAFEDDLKQARLVEDEYWKASRLFLYSASLCNVLKLFH